MHGCASWSALMELVFFFRVELKGGGGGESSLIFFFISVIGTSYTINSCIYIYVYDITAHAGLVIILLYERVNNFIIMICACIQRRQNEITFIFTSVKRKYFRTIITSTDETDFTGHVFRAIQPVPIAASVIARPGSLSDYVFLEYHSA